MDTQTVLNSILENTWRLQILTSELLNRQTTESELAGAVPCTFFHLNGISRKVSRQFAQYFC